MKTSLVIEDAVFEEAKREANKTGKSISVIISQWASLGREQWKLQKVLPQKKFKPLDLGIEKIDLINRKDWMEDLDDDRS